MRSDSKLFKKSALLMLALVLGASLAMVALAAVSQTPLFLLSSDQPNVMILLDNSLSMTQDVNGRFVGTPKIQSARTVVSNLVKSSPGVRFGLTIFNPIKDGGVDGGRVVAQCGFLTAANVDATVQSIEANSYTPLGETLAEIWQYFKGRSSSYNSGVSYTSPITNSCQKSFVVIVTDGEPTLDQRYKDDFASYGWAVSESIRDNSSHLADVARYIHNHPAIATFPDSTITTYTVGFAVDTQILLDTAENGGGQYLTAANEADLATALNTVLTNILGTTSSASAVAVNSANLSSDSMLYRATFNSADWSGTLEAYKLDPSTGDVDSTSSWDAGARLMSRTSPRVIYTAVSGPYRRADFTTTNQPLIASAGFPNFSTAWIGYIRGDTSPPAYRQRTEKLGDIIYSAPVLSGPPDATYRDHNYSAFRQEQADRQSIVLSGANDGMLHAFNAGTGDEQWAFIPKSLLGNLKLLRNKPYIHRNYVDGAITVGDAYIASKTTSGATDSPAWHTIAVCGLREGGKSFFALDITNPDNPIPLWEINASAANNLGYSFATPLILKLKDRDQPEGFLWVAVLANGYEGGARDTASLLIVNLATGEIVKEISDKGTAPNGLATPAAIDVDRDGYADYLYAGDLKGQLWKFDLSSDNTSTWKAELLFTAKDPLGAVQPITTAPDVVVRLGYQYVFFGTGKYYELGDLTATQRQSFYGVKDDNSTKNMTRRDLTAQTVTDIAYEGEFYRVSSSNPIGTTSGWYIDLPATGERVIYDPQASSRKVIFTTFTPSTAPCSSGGTSWLMEVYLDTGGAVIKPVFDVTGDSLVTAGDTVGDGRLPTGMHLGSGLAATPAIVGAGGGLEYKYIGISGTIRKLVEGGSKPQAGLRSWRQIK